MTGWRCSAKVRLLGVSLSLKQFPGTVALAETGGGEAEPVGKDSSAFIVWVKGQQAVQPVLLFTPAPRSAETLGHFCLASLNVDVLLKRVEIQQGEGLSTGVIRPVGSLYCCVHVASIYWVSKVGDFILLLVRYVRL